MFNGLQINTNHCISLYKADL